MIKALFVLYRQFEVGKILSIKPNTNNFDVDIYIYPAYQHLLTDKSRFWVESAAKIDVTPKGISIQATPLARSLKGRLALIMAVQAIIEHFMQMKVMQNPLGL